MSAFVSRRHSKQRPDSLSGERGVRSAFSVATTFQRVIWSPLPPHLNGTAPITEAMVSPEVQSSFFHPMAYPCHWALIRSWLPLFPVGESVQRYLNRRRGGLVQSGESFSIYVHQSVQAKASSIQAPELFKQNSVESVITPHNHLRIDRSLSVWGVSNGAGFLGRLFPSFQSLSR